MSEFQFLIHYGKVGPSSTLLMFKVLSESDPKYVVLSNLSMMSLAVLIWIAPDNSAITQAILL